MLKRNFIYLFIQLILINIGVFASEISEAYIEFKLHNVGQGNCSTAKFYDPKDKLYKDGPLYMLYDAGSSAHDREFLYQAYFHSQRHLDNPKQPTSPSISHKSGIPESDRKPMTAHVLEDIQKFKEEKKLQEKLSKQQDKLPAKKRKITNEEKKGSSTAFASSEGKEKAHTKEDLQDKNKNESPEKKMVLKNIRESLGGALDFSSPIQVKLVILSHPDRDHYNWLRDVFRNPDDRIDTIILGGIPEEYDVSKEIKFRDFLNGCINNGTKVYFPTLSYNSLSIADLKNLYCSNPQERYGKWTFGPDCKYAPQTWSHPDKPTVDIKNRELFGGALNFGEAFKVYFLSINPSHDREANASKVNEESQEIKNNIITRSSQPSDSNVDSLVVKLEHNKQSIMLTGDASWVTTHQIHRNYVANSHILQSTVLVASHHGSSTDNTNDEEWLKLLSPACVLFSNGLQHGHPELKTYDRCCTLQSIKGLDKSHPIWLGEGKNKMEKITISDTWRAIFSTFNSGTLSIKLTGDGPLSIQSRLVIGGTTDSTSNQAIVYQIVDHLSKQDQQGSISELQLANAENYVENELNTALSSSSSSSTSSSSGSAEATHEEQAEDEQETGKGDSSN